MAVIRTEEIYGTNVSGWFDTYETLMKGRSDFPCGCGSPIQVTYRKEFKGNKMYEFNIVHRNKKYKYAAKNPSALAVFDRMIKVAIYAKCDFAGRKRFR